jgi:hypothetical protein
LLGVILCFTGVKIRLSFSGKMLNEWQFTS